MSVCVCVLVVWVGVFRCVLLGPWNAVCDGVGVGFGVGPCVRVRAGEEGVADCACVKEACAVCVRLTRVMDRP